MKTHLKKFDQQHLSCSFEESCNRFLKTPEGLQYLLLKYPTLPLLDAIQEYKNSVAKSEVPKQIKTNKTV